MFSVYGLAGRLFHGPLEDLYRVGPPQALARMHRVQAIGQDAQDYAPFQNHLASQLPTPLPPDIAHRVAVSSYQHTQNEPPARHPLSQVAAIMSHVLVTVQDEHTVEQAWSILSEKGVGQAPVVNAQGSLVGLLSRADLMRPERLPGPQSHALVWRALLLQSVSEVMWTPVPSVVPDADIRRVARVLLSTGLPGLPVVDATSVLVGFVSRSDILRAVAAEPPLDLWT